MDEVLTCYPGLSKKVVEQEDEDGVGDTSAADVTEPSDAGKFAGKVIKSLAFRGYLDDKQGCAKWGPSHQSSVLVEREEYIRLWELIRKNPYRFISIRGSKGIGKSVFIFWLVYRIMKEASEEKKGPHPTFLLIRSSGSGKVYHFLSVEDGVAVTRSVAPGSVCADYVLSDVEYDPAALWNLNVMSYGSRTSLKPFINEVEGVGQVIVLLQMYFVPFFYWLFPQITDFSRLLPGNIFRPG